MVNGRASISTHACANTPSLMEMVVPKIVIVDSHVCPYGVFDINGVQETSNSGSPTLAASACSSVSSLTL